MCAGPSQYCIGWSYTGEIKSEIPARTALFRPGRHKIPGRAESNARFIQCRVEQAGVEGLRRVCRFEERRSGGSAHVTGITLNISYVASYNVT